METVTQRPPEEERTRADGDGASRAPIPANESPPVITATAMGVLVAFGLLAVLGLGLVYGATFGVPGFSRRGGDEVGVQTAAGGPVDVEVVATEFNFTPTRLTMAGPGDLTVTLQNKGLIEHDIVIEGVDGRVLTAGGKTATGVFKLGKPGTYIYFCSITGHREAGMEGKLVIGGSPAANVEVAQAAADAPEPIPLADPNAEPLRLPTVPPPISRSTPELVKLDISVKEVTATMAEGVSYRYWTFDGTVPGPMLRVRQGDTVELTLRNPADSSVTHSIDLHAVTGPGGDAAVMQVPVGEERTFSFKALNPGVYIYHCATPMVAHHIANGMYGLIVVEPPEGLAPVDQEFYVVQGDFYAKGQRGVKGHREFDLFKMLDERADYVVFNGRVGSLTEDNALKAKVGETVRIFFGVGGPNLTSSFHVIGEIFDRVFPEGASEALHNVQTTLVPTGGAAIAEFKVEVPGTYILVDHSLGRLEKGGAGFLVVEGPDNPEVFQPQS